MHRGRWRRCIPFGVLLALTLLALTVASSAQARWGNEKCSLVTHCYAITEVNTSAKGAVAYIQEESANVPEYPAGAFVDDEMWLSFPKGGWLEIGLTAGYNPGGTSNCCTLHPFIAHAVYVNEKGIQGYEEYTWAEVNANSLIHVKIEDPTLNAERCEYIWNGPTTWNQVDCHNKPSYWTANSSTLEAGLEAASNNERPYNGARQEVAQVNDSGGWLAWNGANGETVNENGESAAGVMCIIPNSLSNYPGNAQYWIC
jgi:hypothetical protein